MSSRGKRTPKKSARAIEADAEHADDAVSDAPSGEEKPAPKKRKTAPRKPALTEPETTESGWTLHPPSLIYKGLGGESSQQIAAFDLDGTLVLQKSKAQFARDADDWVLYNKAVPDKLRELQAEGFKLVIFSNQGSIKSALKGKAAEKVTQRVDNILAKIGLELPVLLATNKDERRKPETGMWTHFVEHSNGGVEPDKEKSFFVGDAAGGPGDFADSDRVFAEKVGIGFKTTKEFFGEPDSKVRAATGGSSGQNDAMAQAFREYAAAQEASGANQFAVNACNKAAGIIAAHPTKIQSGKELASVQGIGKSTQAKIDEFVKTGALPGVKKEEGATAQQQSADAEMAMKFV